MSAEYYFIIVLFSFVTLFAYLYTWFFCDAPVKIHGVFFVFIVNFIIFMIVYSCTFILYSIL